jgi:hypothetical protein
VASAPADAEAAPADATPTDLPPEDATAADAPPADPRTAPATGGPAAESGPDAYSDERTTVLGGNGRPTAAAGGNGTRVLLTKEPVPEPSAAHRAPAPKAEGTPAVGDGPATPGGGTRLPGFGPAPAPYGPGGEGTGGHAAPGTPGTFASVPPGPDGPDRPGGNAGGGKRKGRRGLVIAAGVVVVALLGTVFALSLNGKKDEAHGKDTGGTSASTGGSGGHGTAKQPGEQGTGRKPGGSGSGSATPGTGTGSPQKTYNAPEGFSVGLPAGWVADQVKSDEVHFKGPQGQQLDITWDSGANPLTALYSQASNIDLDKYHQISIGPADYRDWPAADWQFTYEDQGTPYRRIDRDFVASGVGYAMMYTAKTSDWDTGLRSATWSTFTRTFQPKK